jgi:hypothetical protein
VPTHHPGGPPLLPDAEMRLIEGQLGDGERVTAVIDSRIRTGPLPWSVILRGYYLVLTDRRLAGLFHRSLTGRPGDIAFEIPLGDRDRVEIVERPLRIRVTTRPGEVADLLLDPRYARAADEVCAAFA